MNVILFHEGICPSGTTWHQRLREAVDEAVLAEECGFDGYAVSEQHFASGEAITSSPEIILPYVAARTERLRLRIASVNLLPYNHPIRVIEQMATLDLLSNGRAELGGARSNNPYTLDAFNVDPKLTREYRDEHLEIIGKGFTQEKLEHDSEFYKIPPRKMSPWPVGRRPVPVHLSATSIESHEEAGAMGVGAMTGLSILGWDYAQACIDAYRKGAENARNVAGAITTRQALFSVGVNCHTDRATALATTKENTVRFIEVIMDWMTKLAKRSEGYEYFAAIEKIRQNMHDLDYLIESSPYIMAGTPDELIKRARRLHDMGIDDVIWRIDGMGHENNKNALRLIGKEVLPELHSWKEHAQSTPSSTWNTQ
ncbi:LLM class flavin-dependent oxidoreductase [Alcaligenaceae bacterium]|nr:LLM class flavin-dependent oxidoreductase [Alcaligenaceae bacterium]